MTETSDHQMEPEQKPPRRRLWRARHAAGACVSLVLLGVICIFGALAATLALGRLNLEAFRPLLTSSLQQRLGAGYRVDIGAMAVERGEHGISLALDGFTVSREDGRRLVTAPRALMMFDPLSLLAGRIKLSRVELDGLKVELRVSPDGALDLSAGSTETPGDETAPGTGDKPAPTIGERPEFTATPQASPQASPNISVTPPTSAPASRARAMREVGNAVNSIFDFAQGEASPIAALDHFGIKGGRLIVDDRVAGQTRGFDDFAFSLDRSREAKRGVARIAISARGPSGRWSVEASARGARGEAHELAFDASGFSIDEIALLMERASLPVDSDIPIALRASASFAGSGHMLEANARLALGQGFWRFDDPDFAPVLIDEMFVGVHWDSGAHRIVLDSAQIFSGATRFFLAGAIVPPTSDDAPWTIAFRQTEPGVIGPDRAGEKPVTLTVFHGDLSFDAHKKQFSIHRIEAVGPEVAAAVQGSLDWSEGPHLRLGLSAGKSSAAGILALWPNSAGAPVRGWAAEHVLGGILESATMAVDLDDLDLRMMRAQHAPMDDRIAIEYTVRDATVSFLDDAPPVAGLSGAGRSSGRQTRFAAAAAFLEAAPGRKIDLSDGVMSMPDLETKPLALSISARARGTIEALGEILARPGFAQAVSLPIDPKTTRGQFDGSFAYRTRLQPIYDPKLSSIDVSARVENFSAEKLVGKEKLDQATLQVSLENGVTRIAGTGKLFGAPATLELNRQGAEPAQGMVSFVMDEAARTRAGANFGASVSGPLAVKATGQIGVSPMQAQIEMDLTRTGLNYPVPGLYKPAGRAGKANFLYREDERGGATLDQIVFEGGGASARGQMQFSPEGALTGFKLPQVKFSPGDTIQVEGTRAGGVLKISAKGPAVDSRPFLRSLTAAGESGPDANGDLDFDLNATLLTGANRQIVSNAQIRLARRNARFQALNFSGKLGGDAVLGALARGEDGAPVLQLTSSDAGAFLAFLDAYSHMEGGELSAAIRLSGEPAGSVDIERFVLRGEPALRSFAETPNGDQIAARVRLDPNVVAFSRLHAWMGKEGSRLNIRDGAVSSPSIGATMEGWVDFERDLLDMSGVFVPAYGVNNLFGKVPIVGQLLGGGSQEGLIGVNFRVTGRPTAPNLTVNPLSVIAPGFLRKIFGVPPN